MFNIQLTKNGKAWLSKQVTNDKPVKLSVAIGDGGTAATETDSELKNLKMWADNSEIEKLTIDNTLHISANFFKKDKNNSEFDIKEIGVFVELEPNKNMLLGRYGSQKTLAKKTENIDLFLDILLHFKNYNTENLTIDASHYKPQFKNNYASYVQAGTVRFANKADIIAGEKGLAISSEMLRNPGIITREALREDCHLVNAKITIEDNSSTGKISSLFYDNKNTIYCLFYINETTISLLPYNILANKFELGKNLTFKLSDSTVRLKNVPDMYLYNKDDQELHFLGYTTNTNSSSAYKFTLKIETKKITSSLLGGHDDANALGTLSIFNTYPILIGGDTQASTQIIFYNNNKDTKLEIKLKKPRKLPLVHTIQDKIYCFGGEASKNKQTLEILQPINKSIYVTPISDTFDLTDTTNLTSSVLGYKIYIFNKNNFFGDKGNFYSYDYLSGYWKLHTIPKHLEKVKNLKETSAKSIVADNAIYVCFCEPANGFLNLSMVQYIPT